MIVVVVKAVMRKIGHLFLQGKVRECQEWRWLISPHWRVSAWKRREVGQGRGRLEVWESGQVATCEMAAVVVAVGDGMYCL